MTDFPDDADGQALARLAQSGVDMTKPISFDFMVAAPDEATAEAIGKSLQAAGYDVELEYDEGEPIEDRGDSDDDGEFGPSWTIYVTISMVPKHSEILRVQQELDALAAQFGGHSDGWGAWSN